MKKSKKRPPHVDTYGIPLPLDYILIKNKEDILYQMAPRKKMYDKLIITPLTLELAHGNILSHNAFRIFCYIGSCTVQENVCYTNGKEAMSAVGIKKSTYSVSLKELLQKGFIREIGSKEGFTPSNKSDRIFLLSPAYMWKGFDMPRENAVKQWYRPVTRGGWNYDQI